MAKVKGPAVVNYVVVAHKPLQRQLAFWGSIGILIAIGYFAFWIGGQTAVSVDEANTAERVNLKQELTQIKIVEESLRQKVAVLENAAAVDQGAIESVRQSNRQLSDRVAELEQEVALYQGIMSPSADSAGLTIQSVSISPTAATHRYRYRVMLTQIGSNSNYLNGFFRLTLTGIQNNAEVTYPLASLSEDVESMDIKFRYRYFQEFVGELTLPEEFTPDQLEVVAQSTGSKAVQIEKLYNWSELEIENNVGQ